MYGPKSKEFMNIVEGPSVSRRIPLVMRTASLARCVSTDAEFLKEERVFVV
jgi:hypothetical protein